MKNKGIIILAVLLCTALLGVAGVLLYAIRPSSIETRVTSVAMDQISAQAETERLIAQAREQRKAEIEARVNSANEVAIASAVNPIEVERGNVVATTDTSTQQVSAQSSETQTTQAKPEEKPKEAKPEEKSGETKPAEKSEAEDKAKTEAESKTEEAKLEEAKTTETKSTANSNSVYNTIMAYKNKSGYTQGTSWTNDNKSYSTNSAWYDALGFTGANGCAAFAYELSDAAFGNAPIKVHTDQSAIKIGDVLRCTGSMGSHKVIVIGVSDTDVTVAEGNFNSAVNWGRKISRSELASYCNDIITRY